MGCATIVRRFRDVIVVNDISFSIGRGEICALLEPNGAEVVAELNKVRRLIGIVL